MINKKIAALLLVAFLFRLGFGLLYNGNMSDDIQTYLVGLKYYCTDEWPYFGPATGGSETTFATKLPGALEGFLIGSVLRIFPFAEAPFVFVNILSVAAIFFFAWYCQKRFPMFSLFYLLLYLLFLPMPLFMTCINNMSFIIFGSVVFFIGFFESLPEFSLGLIPEKLAYAMMGFSFFWIMQFHLSWIFLVPLILVTFVMRLSRDWKGFILMAVFFIVGSLPTLAFLIPTFIKYGLAKAIGGKGYFVPFEWRNFFLGSTILQRYLLLANFKIDNLFPSIDSHFSEFMKLRPIFWVYAIAEFLLKYISRFEVFCLILFWLFRDHARPAWKETKFLTVILFFSIWSSFWFTVKFPLAHIYWVAFPVVMVYSLYGWSRFSEKANWAKAGKVILILNIIYVTAFPILQMHDYVYRKRADLQSAIDQKNYHLFAEPLVIPF
jgi:hypothetical protein